MNNILKIPILFVLLIAWTADAATKRTYGMRPHVYEKVQAIQMLLDEKQLNPAIEAIDKLQELSLSDYELAQTWDIKGITFYQLNKLNEAVQSYEQVVQKMDAIPEGMYMRSLKTLAQLNMMTEDYVASLNYAQQLLALEKSPDLHMLVAQAHFRRDDFTLALKACQAARVMQQEKQRPMKENWLQLENAIHHALDDYPAMLQVLEELLTHYPKTQYFKYTASVYGELDNTQKQTGILETLYEQGELNTSGELTNLASLYQIQKVPYKSATLLEEQIQQGNLEESERVLNLLVSAWTLAKEDKKALAALEKLTALSQSSDDYIRLAYHYFDNKEWQKSIEAVSIALQQESTSDPGNALVLQGMAQMKLKHFDDAADTFVLASRYDDAKKLAGQWLRFSAKEQQKYEELASMGITLPDRTR